MKPLENSVSFMCGSNRSKVSDVTLSFGNITLESGTDWTYDVICTGKIEINESGLEANSRFDCIILGTAYLRQATRELLHDNQKLKFYEEYAGKLEVVAINDLFWTHDCD